jgi:hypothetical protein
MDIASIASFLLPTLLSMLSGEGYQNIQEKIFPSSKKSSLRSNIPKMAMYWYGYRYPNYRFRWVRTAVGNRAIAQKSPWLAFLRQKNAFKEIGDKLRKLSAEYRATHGVKESTRKGARGRMKKLERAIAALQDKDLLARVATDLGDVYNANYVADIINRLTEENERLKAIIEWQQQAVAQPVETVKEVLAEEPTTTKTKSSTKKKGQGYGLLSGLGYGYFY